MLPGCVRDINLLFEMSIQKNTIRRMKYVQYGLDVWKFLLKHYEK